MTSISTRSFTLARINTIINLLMDLFKKDNVLLLSECHQYLLSEYGEL